jgi:hypothetical protein
MTDPVDPVDTAPGRRVIGPDHRLVLELGHRMCAALGIDPSDVVGLEYRWTPTELPTVTIHRLLTEGVVLEVLRLRPDGPADG